MRLPVAILDALEDDTMHTAEIARQLAKRGVHPTPAQLTVTLRRMWANGRLRERTILGVQCFAAAPAEPMAAGQVLPLERREEVAT